MGIVSVQRLFLLLMLLTHAGCIDIPITCDAGTYAPGQSAFITCNLYDSVRTQNLDVTLVQYPVNATEGNLGKDIMTCRWQEGEKKQRCNTRTKGYELVDEVDMERPTVMIRSVNDTFAGLYMCFIIPPDGTRSHGCQLTVRAGWKNHTQLTQATCTNRAGANSLLWIIVLPVLVALALGALVFVLWRRNHFSRKQMQLPDDFTSVQPLLNKCDSLPRDEMNRPEAPNLKVQDALQLFILSKSHIDVLMKHLRSEMRPKPGTKPTINMIPTRIRSFPTGHEKGDILVIDLDGTVLQIELVKLYRPQFYICERYPFVPATEKGTGNDQLGFIAECVDVFAGANHLHNTDLPLALVFHFLCVQGSDLSQATLAKWEMGFEGNDILGKDIGKLLQEALQAKNPALKFKIKVIVNNAVGSLVSAAVTNPTCEIALILDNGFNGCFFEQQEGASVNNAKKNKVIVTTEWGCLGEDGCLNMIRNPIDIDLDNLSGSQAKLTLEKMVSRKYIGEIVRLVLLKLISEGLLFKSNDRALTALSKVDIIRADFVALIESDTSNHYLNTKFVLRQLELDNYKEEDWKTVRYVCRTVSDRAANLASAALATLINLIGRPDGDITVAVDGSQYQYHPHFHDLIYSKTRELLNEELKGRFKLVSSENGSVRGAALLAAISS